MHRIKFYISVLFIGCCTLKGFAQKETDDNKFSGNRNNPQRQEWLRDKGFGMFIHFNVDAQLGITISHSLVGASDDYLRRYYNELPKTFDPYKFNAYEIAKLAKLAGMRYIVFTVKHHSGFCFWDTKSTDFNIMHTPYGKDLLKQYVEGVRKAGLAVGIYYSPEDFKFLYDHKILIKRGDIKFKESELKAYKALVKQQTTELFTNYGKIDVLFIDGEPKEPCKEVAWTLQPNVVITRGAINTPEQTLPGVALDQFWESCITMGTQWNYKPTNDNIKTGGKLIELLIEARAKGGNFLLNVGPHPDGYIPYEEEVNLREMAAWNFINAEAIQNVRPWIIVRENNIWFTASKDKKTVYAIVTKQPNWALGERKEIILKSVRSTASTKISVLGQNSQVIEYRNKEDASCRFEQKADGLHLSVVRAQRIYDNNKWPDPITIKLEGIEPALDPPIIVTGDVVIQNDEVMLKGSLIKKGRVPEVSVGFEYRLYGGFAENLYSTEWNSTAYIKKNNEGDYVIPLKGLQKNKQYEFRAVVMHPDITIQGDVKTFVIK
ncbi:alpha-L-fucosidase [Mucilaginibacter boryungensis]|uniref:alpha-L-fucosidase n=1 Tax=Mucilaginibacter boryungensis TaxID=768480 RepID=A0ABR9XIG1_9SPHI|nr:alpha-L-fucosidase [Mucilaginibacter boryungensis]MBE9667161.1 alpha-L-fucosidase [Mucilaginibacter boryungensis]